MVVAFTSTETNYLMVNLFCDLVLPFSYSRFYSICFVSGIVTKAALSFPNSFTIF